MLNCPFYFTITPHCRGLTPLHAAFSGPVPRGARPLGAADDDAGGAGECCEHPQL